MKTIRIKEMPKGYERNDSEELADYELEVIEKLGIEEARYWYGTGCYEGSGHLLMLKGGMWYHHDMGHCSCYGPTERIELTQGYPSLQHLIDSCSDDLQKELSLLIPNASHEARENKKG